MSLNFIKLGQGHPLIILHGLYGSGSNWLSIARQLSGFGEIYLLDQRNHGASPHYSVHTYTAMMQDLIGFMDEQGLRKAILLGHSMGGKTAIYTAIHHPERVSHLIVADISPLAYNPKDGFRHNLKGHEVIMNALLGLNLSKVHSLHDADRLLEPDFPDRILRQFLLKNLAKNAKNRYDWKINLRALLENLGHLSEGIDPEEVSTSGYRHYPVIFIRGAKSNYIQEEDETGIRRIFPLAQLVSIQNAGHWLHAEQPEVFIQVLKKFLLG